jgi:hypothetical protein
MAFHYTRFHRGITGVEWHHRNQIEGTVYMDWAGLPTRECRHHRNQVEPVLLSKPPWRLVWDPLYKSPQPSDRFRFRSRSRSRFRIRFRFRFRFRIRFRFRFRFRFRIRFRFRFRFRSRTLPARCVLASTDAAAKSRGEGATRLPLPCLVAHLVEVKVGRQT